MDDSESRNENDNEHSNATLKTEICLSLLAKETIENSLVELRDVTPVGATCGKEPPVAPSGSKREATEQGPAASVYLPSSVGFATHHAVFL